jgi:hypothetical protein
MSAKTEAQEVGTINLRDEILRENSEVIAAEEKTLTEQSKLDREVDKVLAMPTKPIMPGSGLNSALIISSRRPRRSKRSGRNSARSRKTGLCHSAPLSASA